MSTDNPLGAFIPGERCIIEGAADGPLDGLTFAAKDLFDVAGHVTGGGNPDWPKGRPLPQKNAWAVQQLLNGGADLVGKTITDEISLGILGENAFYGTPTNPNAPGRVPGGSSSGSAAAVAGGYADLAIGTDTGGSVRVPASFCGLYGIRPTHGSLPLDGMAPQAPTSDTTGWFARDAETFARAAGVMFDAPTPEAKAPACLRIATDAFGFADPDAAAALQPLVARLASMASTSETTLLAPQGLSVWGKAQRTIQPHEAWATFKDWVERYNPPMAHTVSRGLMAGASVPADDLRWARLMRLEAAARMQALTADGAIICLPTTPFPAPPKAMSLPEMDLVRERILCLAAHGGLAGCPQISIPGALVDGIPIGLSLVAARGADLHLFEVARALAEDAP